jgi:hypothetical protein
MEATSPRISGGSLVNFDINVVAPNNLTPNGPLGISYSGINNTCILVCHTVSHNYDGTVTRSTLQVNTAKHGGKIGR